MNVKKAFLFSAALLGCSLFAGPAPQQAQQALSNVDRRFFIENKGQWPAEVLYLTRMGGLDVWITRYGAVYDFYRIEETSDRSETGAADAPTDDMARFSDARRYGHVVRLRLKGAQTEDITAAGQDPQPGYYNYFIGNDPSKWASFVGLYRAAVVRDVYAGIDVRYYYDGTGVRYDFIVRPGADVAAIRLALEGAEGVRITDRGELAFTTRFGEVRHAGLRAYQTADDGREVDVACRFTPAGDGTYGFEAGAYDPARPLIIDPLIYSTFIGGSLYEYGQALAVDGSGHAHATGYTLSTNFPTTPGAYDTTIAVGAVFVTKLDSSGSNLIYSTFIGGTSANQAFAIALDNAKNIYVTGGTNSNNFPTTSGAYDTSSNGSWDVFVTKLNSSGSNLLYSTFIGGNTTEQGNAIALDAAGNAYVTGKTNSNNFPTTSGAYDTTAHGSYDVFVTKLDSNGSNLIYSTFIGGVGTDHGNAIALDAAGNAYVTGFTFSNSFPATSGAYDQTHNGYSDAFVAKLNSSGSSLMYATFIGGSSGDVGYALALDAAGNVYITGETVSDNFPATWGAHDTSSNGIEDAFVTKLNNSGSNLIYSTFIGGNGHDIGYALALDAIGNAYITGITFSNDFPTTSGAYDTSFNGIQDVFLTGLNSNGSNLTYSTFIGGSHADFGQGIALDAAGNAYITGFTYSNDFPTISGVYDTSFNGKTDVFVTKLNTGAVPVGRRQLDETTAGPVILGENPTDGVLRLDASALAGQPLDVRILDAAGREVYRHRYTDSRRVRLTIDGPAGVYTVRLQWRDGQRTYRLMKK